MVRQKLKDFIGNIVKKTIPKVEEYEYGIIASSRKVIKSIDGESIFGKSYYNVDIWELATKQLKDIIPKGFTLYYEIIGYLPTGGYIQGPFDYGCKVGEYKLYVYRITLTNADGIIIELDDKQIEEFCEKNGLNYKDTFIFYGTVGQHFNQLKYQNNNSTEIFPDDWREQYLEKLIKNYNEKDCYMCVNKVPSEGIVIRKQELFDYTVYKLKSFSFLERETKNLDKGIIDIESQN